MFATGVTVGLAEWIIDDARLFHCVLCYNVIMNALGGLYYGYLNQQWSNISIASFFEPSHNKTGVINDPLGQPTVPAGSNCRLILKFWDGRT